MTCDWCLRREAVHFLVKPPPLTIELDASTTREFRGFVGFAERAAFCGGCFSNKWLPQHEEFRADGWDLCTKEQWNAA